ncbi:hypothetical protein BC835DRAFT_1530503 [Cytidiella melzeri]|nr:hypothetical protein BC835DRAFT_1530503 [Cytidiella melzeri]
MTSVENEKKRNALRHDRQVQMCNHVKTIYRLGDLQVYINNGHHPACHESISRDRDNGKFEGFPKRACMHAFSGTYTSAVDVVKPLVDLQGSTRLHGLEENPFGGTFVPATTYTTQPISGGTYTFFVRRLICDIPYYGLHNRVSRRRGERRANCGRECRDHHHEPSRHLLENCNTLLGCVPSDREFPTLQRLLGDQVTTTYMRDTRRAAGYLRNTPAFPNNVQGVWYDLPRLAVEPSTDHQPHTHVLPNSTPP